MSSMNSPGSHNKNPAKLALALRGKVVGVGMAALLVLAAVFGSISRYPFLPQTDSINPSSFAGVTDERLAYYQSLGLMSPHRQGWPQVVAQPDQPPIRSMRTDALGRRSLEHPEFYFIDRPALADPFLSRLPAVYLAGWFIGHHIRYLPTDYFYFVIGRAETIADENLHGLLQDTQLAAHAPELFTWKRLAAIWRLNSGHYADLDLRRYQDPQSHIPLVSPESCFIVSLDDLEAKPQPAAYNWRGRGILGRFYHCLRVKMDEPRLGDALSVSLSKNRDYEIRVNGQAIKTIARVDTERELKNHSVPLPRRMQVAEIEIHALGCRPAYSFWVGHLLIQQGKDESMARIPPEQGVPISAQIVETDLLQDGLQDQPQPWTISGPGRFEYDFERIDGAPVLKVRALEDMPWLAVFVHAKDMDSGLHHRVVTEAGNNGSLRLILETWDFEGEADVRHSERQIYGRLGCPDWRALPLDFGTDRERDYAAVVAQGIKAGEEFHIHRLLLHNNTP